MPKNLKSQVTDCNSRKIPITTESRRKFNFVATKNFMLTRIQNDLRGRPLIRGNFFLCFKFRISNLKEKAAEAASNTIQKKFMQVRFKVSLPIDLGYYLEEREFRAVSENRSLEVFYQSCAGQNSKFLINFGKFQHCLKNCILGCSKIFPPTVQYPFKIKSRLVCGFSRSDKMYRNLTRIFDSIL